MDLFRADGHLSEEALRLLAQNQVCFNDLERLETAEHLAFCDYCLQRYTYVLESAPLLTPQNSCQKSLWTRVRMRSLQLITSRYATAAAAVTIALTVLWGGTPVEFVRPALPEDRPSISRRLTDWTGEIRDSLHETASGISNLFENLRPDYSAQGGN